MLVGGIDPHRYDLSSMVMLKDNHIWSKGDSVKSLSNPKAQAMTGSITGAVQAARSVCGFSLKIDVECQSEEEAAEAIAAGADIVMLDNFTPQALSTAASNLRSRFGESKFLIEVSGGVTEENIKEHIYPGACDTRFLRVKLYSTQASTSFQPLRCTKASNTSTLASSCRSEVKR
jgi:nicotinate-nucleotide pyrophosphorylase (carboxylating)